MRLEINDEFICNINVSYKWGKNLENGTMSYVEHPAFAALRAKLLYMDYISKGLGCNSDVVLKAFVLNGHKFRIGDILFSACALKNKFKDSTWY